VYGNSSSGLFTDGEKTLDDAVTGRRTIDEEQVLVIKSSICELLCLVQALVETYDGGDSMSEEVREIMVWGVKGVSVLYPAFVVGTGEGEEFAWMEGKRWERKDRG
jgi:hypothetical protein